MAPSLSLLQDRTGEILTRTNRVTGTDCEAELVIVQFPEAFPPEMRPGAVENAKWWNPEEYTAITGESVPVSKTRYGFGK